METAELRRARRDPAIPRGIGIVPKAEEIAEGSAGTAVRYRNIGEHPLTLAFERGQIDKAQFEAGDGLRTVCETLRRSGKDSTDLERVRSSATPVPFTDAQVDAAHAKGNIRARLGGARSANWIICEAICGDGWSMRDAIRKANIPCHPNGVVSRVQEALDALAGRKTTKRAWSRPKVEEIPVKTWTQTVCAGCRADLKGREAIKSRVTTEAFGTQVTLKVCSDCHARDRTIDPADLVDDYRDRLWLPPLKSETAAKRPSPQKVASAA